MLTATHKMFRIFITACSAVAIAWIAYKQAKLALDMKPLEKNTNSMKDELVKEVRIASIALGKKQSQDEHSVGS